MRSAMFAPGHPICRLDFIPASPRQRLIINDLGLSVMKRPLQAH